MTLQRSEVLMKRLNQPFAERQVLDVQRLDLQYEWGHQQQYPEQQTLPCLHLVYSPPELPLVLRNLGPTLPSPLHGIRIYLLLLLDWTQQTISRCWQWNLSSTMKKRDLQNPSCRSTHSFNPVAEKNTSISFTRRTPSFLWTAAPMDFKTHRICMLRLGVPSFFVLLSQTGARCLLHSSETSVYHEIFLVFSSRVFWTWIVKLLKP